MKTEEEIKEVLNKLKKDISNFEYDDFQEDEFHAIGVEDALEWVLNEKKFIVGLNF